MKNLENMSSTLNSLLYSVKAQYPGVENLDGTFSVDGVKVLIMDSFDQRDIMLISPLPVIPQDMQTGVVALLLRELYRFRETRGTTIAMGKEGLFVMQLMVPYCDTPEFLRILKQFAQTVQIWKQRIGDMI